MTKPQGFLVATDIIVLAVAQASGVTQSPAATQLPELAQVPVSAQVPELVQVPEALEGLSAVPSVLLITRKNEPYRGQFALPGGFVDPGEVTRSAALRELAEETSLAGAEIETRLEQVGAYGPAGRRDPRGEVLTVAYVAVLDRELVATAADDAASAEWVPLAEALAADLAFDHSDILRDAVLQSGARYPALAALLD